MLKTEDLLKLDNLPDLIVAAERVASSVIQGSHGRRRAGIGESFWQFRNYMPSDSARSIDWRQTAKRDMPFIRQTEWEASQTIILWNDNSGSMNYSSDSKKYLSKQRYSILMLLSLASALLRSGETIMIPGHRPVQGYPSLSHIAQILMTQKYGLDNLGKLPKDAHAIFITDGLEPLNIWADNIHALAHRRLTAQFIQVLDPAERDLPFSGHTVFEGLEDGEEIERIADVGALREAYQEKLEEHQKQLQNIVNTSGWVWHSMATDIDTSQAVLPIYTGLMHTGKG